LPWAGLFTHLLQIALATPIYNVRVYKSVLDNSFDKHSDKMKLLVEKAYAKNCTLQKALL
jgi:hypothetical protein